MQAKHADLSVDAPKAAAPQPTALKSQGPKAGANAAATQIHRSLKAWRSEDADDKAAPAGAENAAAKKDEKKDEQAEGGGAAAEGAEAKGADGAGEEKSEEKVATKRVSPQVNRKVFRDATKDPKAKAKADDPKKGMSGGQKAEAGFEVAEEGLHVVHNLGPAFFEHFEKLESVVPGLATAASIGKVAILIAEYKKAVDALKAYSDAKEAAAKDKTKKSELKAAEDKVKAAVQSLKAVLGTVVAVLNFVVLAPVLGAIAGSIGGLAGLAVGAAFGGLLGLASFFGEEAAKEFVEKKLEEKWVKPIEDEIAKGKPATPAPPPSDKESDAEKKLVELAAAVKAASPTVKKASDPRYAKVEAGKVAPGNMANADRQDAANSSYAQAMQDHMN